ncbi:MAG: hypothetical protein QF521_07085, partial [Alphaproteobacteria bacterium]|nr:hypothetical protein [Alphaproteobacteria bacterium]
MSTRELIIPDGLENLYTEKGYAPGIRVGNMLYVSGMLGRDETLHVIKEPEAQFARVFENGEVVIGDYKAYCWHQPPADALAEAREAMSQPPVATYGKGRSLDSQTKCNSFMTGNCNGYSIHSPRY